MKKHLITLILSMHVLLVFGQTNPTQQREEWQAKFFSSPDFAIPLLVDAAIMNSPDIEILETTRKASKNQLKLAKKEPLRSIRLSASYGYGSMNNWFDESQLNNFSPFNLDARSQYALGIGINYNLEQLTGGRRLRVQNQELMVQQSEAQRKQGERVIRQNVIVLYQELVLAKVSLDHFQDALQTAYVNSQLVDKQFREGNIRVEEQMAVQDVYNNAKLAQVQASNQYETALLMLEETIGMTINTLMNSK
ncbi:TolC family protein [Pontibacter silvestris]|uniref:TolC family protein n=1 Tax=Pontibacter silvestris TaxID=2305183 RepID=A0ABW4WY92_9BACT|nr:TolC family protein [Pontibacter silvestris]MCC9138832.1 TolC family protein [Pontibacter silvestris]